jgi:hypothetical protein
MSFAVNIKCKQNIYYLLYLNFFYNDMHNKNRQEWN